MGYIYLYQQSCRNAKRSAGVYVCDRRKKHTAEILAMVTPIDLNCDLGESSGAYTIGMDAEILPYVTSANIACGFHVRATRP